MAFSSLSPEARATILLRLKGAAQYIKGMDAAIASTLKLDAAVTKEGFAAEVAARKNFVLTQAMYTVRRYAYFGTLAIVGLGAAALKMGFDFDRSMETTVVSLRGFTHNTKLAQKEAHQLYLLAAETPFEFTDLSLAARRLLPGFNGNLQQTNVLLKTIGDSLAGFGITSGAALQRATLQLEHMMLIGHVTGQVLMNLNRDNIPMTRALGEAFHATGAQIKEAVSRGAISAQDAIKALEKYVNDPRHAFFGAAQRLGLKTLTGNWTTFHDLVAASFGTSELGGFNFLTKRLKDINLYLINAAKRGEPLTITKLAEAINKSLTPGTGRIIQLFIMFRTAMQDVWKTMRFGMDVINGIVGAFGKLTGLFTTGATNAKLYGHFLGILIDLWILEKTVTIAAAIAQTAYSLATLRGVRASKAMVAIQKLQTYWTAALATETTTRYVKSTAVATETTFILQTRMAKFVQFIRYGMIPAIAAWMAETVSAIALGYAAGGMMGALSAAAGVLTAAIGAIPIVGWILLAISALITLYLTWKPFHDLVNKTFRYIWDNKYMVANALTIAFGPLGTVIANLASVLNLMHALSGGVGTLTHPSRWSAKGAARTGLGIASHVPGLGTAIGIGESIWGAASHFQSGGIVGSGGIAVVGERGPEVVHLPAGSQVTPNHQLGNLALAGAGGGQPIVINLMLRERVLEQVMVDIQAKRNARR